MALKLEGAIAPVFVLLWSTGFIIAKLAMPYVEPATFLFWRYVGILLAMGALSLVWRPASWPNQSQLLHLLVAGMLLQFGYLMGVWSAVRLGMTAGLVALIVGLQPIITAWFAAWVSEHVSPRQWLGLLLGIAGVGLVVAEKMNFVPIPVASYVLAVAALLAITFGTLYQKKYCPAFDLRSGSLIQFSIALLLSFLCMVLFIMIRKGAATKVTSLLYLTPPTTAIMAWLLFDEPLTWMMAAGIVLTMGAVVLVNQKARQ
jgi:drug/metabolite transporter (DMT)-like permease